MIYWMQYLDGFPIDMKNIGNRVFEFKVGVNVLWGANGSGKSVTLKTLKAYCGIEKGGWTRVNDPSNIGTSFLGTMAEAMDFPHAYRQYTPSKIMANVAWSGNPTFYNEGDIKVNDVFFYQNVGQSDDGITDESEQFDALVSKPSSGQYRLQKINKILNMLEKGPENTREIGPNIKNVVMAKREIKYWDYLLENSKVDKKTVLLDEPERALSLPKQKELLLNIIPELAKKYQVIMATHSIFALLIPDANIIDMEPNYSNICKELLKNTNFT